MNEFNEKLMDERYPEGYFDHFNAMFQFEADKQGFKEHAKLYIKIEGFDEFKNLVNEILDISKNNDWDYFVYLAEKYNGKCKSLSNIKELAESAIEVLNKYKEK